MAVWLLKSKILAFENKIHLSFCYRCNVLPLPSLAGNTTHVSGMLPHITKEMVKYCCPQSKITFGYHFGSISDVEEHFQDETFIDISFPLYGYDGEKSTQYKVRGGNFIKRSQSLKVSIILHHFFRFFSQI